MIFAFLKMMKEGKEEYYKEEIYSRDELITLHPNGCMYRNICPVYPDKNHMDRPENLNVPYDCNTLKEKINECKIKIKHDEYMKKGKEIVNELFSNR